MVTAGAVTSVDSFAASNPGWSVVGCTPISANRFTVACRMLWSATPKPLSCWPSKPQDHCTVPAPNTSAPLFARYRVILCVDDPGATSLPQGTETWLLVVKKVEDMSTNPAG